MRALRSAVCVVYRHGPVSRCAITHTAEFIETYLALGENDGRRRALETQYGRKNLERMALEYQHERENAAWLKENTMACAGCETHVEKNQGEWRAVGGSCAETSAGCNHMTWVRCVWPDW
jgi:E3 ubiquitin-protein ligase RNF14